MADSSSHPLLPLAEVLTEALVGLGIHRVYLVPGFNVDPLVIALADHPSITCIPCAQELAAGMMAHGDALAGGVPVACLAMGGPGASAVLPAAVCARVERAPVLFLTGGMPSWSRGLSAFQSDDSQGGRDLELFEVALDHSASLNQPEELGSILERAAGVLASGAPFHLKIPHDCLVETLRPLKGPLGQSRMEVEQPSREFLAWGEKARPRLALLVGEDPVEKGAFEVLQRFAEAHHVPVATTLGAKGALPEDHPLSLGHFGYAGSPRAAEALLDPDLDGLMVLGADLGDRNTSRWHMALWNLGDKLICLRDQPPDAGAFARGFLQFRGFWPDWLKALSWPQGTEARMDWVGRLKEIPLSHEGGPGWDSETPLHPGRFVQTLRDLLPSSTTITVDAGAHRVFTAHHWRALAPRTLLSASRTAPLGWGIAAGLGAAMALPDERVWILSGDGCMGVCGMELAQAVRLRLPVTVVVFNNGTLGNVHLRYRAKSEAAAALARLPQVDWCGFAASMGIPATRVARIDEISAAVVQAQAEPGPSLLEVLIQAEASLPAGDTVFSPCGPPPAWFPDLA